jgi:hypothetical protein
MKLPVCEIQISMRDPTEPISMGDNSKIKYNLHQMNKEIIHQAAQAHAENLYTTIERSE